MKLKQYLTLGLGVTIGFGLSLAGISHASGNKNNKVSLITSEKAKSIMMSKVPGATISEFSYDGDDKIVKYDGTLIKDNYEYEIDVNAKTGEIIKFEKEMISISKNDSNSQSSNINSSNSVNNQDNIKPNTNTNNHANSTNSNTTQNNNTTNNTGVATTSYIGESKARSIMLNRVPGATITSFYLENDSTPEYEGKLIKDNLEYEISVNAKTGAITEFSQDTVDKYDNDDKYDDDRYDNDDTHDDYDDDDKYDDDNDDDEYDD